MPNANPYSAAANGRASRQVQSNAPRATTMTGPRSNGAKENPARIPAARARPRWRQRKPERPSSGAVVAELPLLVGEPSERQDEEAGLAEEFVGASGDNTRGGPIPPVIDIDLFVLELFFVVFECGTGRAFLEQHVE